MAHNSNVITKLIKKANGEIPYMQEVTIFPPFITCGAVWFQKNKFVFLFASLWLLSPQAQFSFNPSKSCLLPSFCFPRCLLCSSAPNAWHPSPLGAAGNTGVTSRWLASRGKAETVDRRWQQWQHADHWTRWSRAISTMTTPVIDVHPQQCHPQKVKGLLQSPTGLLTCKWYPENCAGILPAQFLCSTLLSHISY